MRPLWVVLLLMVPMATAQGDTLSLYPHYESSAGRWLSTVADEPSATQTSSGGNPLIHPLGVAGGNTDVAYSWDYPYRPASPEAIALDVSRDVVVQLEVIVYLTYGAIAPTPASVDVSWELRSGSGLVAAGAPQHIGPTPGSTPTTLVWSEAPQIDSVADPSTIQLHVLMDGPAANYWIVTEREDASYVHLPLRGEAAGPQTINQTLTQALPVVQHTFTHATHDTYRFAWSTAMPAFGLLYNGSVEAGNATVSLQGPDGAAAQVVLEQSGADRVRLDGAGNWTIEVRYAGFLGNLSLAFEAAADGDDDPQPEPGPQAEPQPDPEPDNGPADDGPEDTQETAPEDATTPWPGLLALPLLLAAAWRAGRRT